MPQFSKQDNGRALIKTTCHMHIGTVIFSSLFKESHRSPVVTFPSFSWEGYGVQPPCRGFVFNFTYVLSYNRLFYLSNQAMSLLKTFLERTSNPHDSKVYLSCFVLFIQSLFFFYFKWNRKSLALKNGS